MILNISKKLACYVLTGDDILQKKLSHKRIAGNKGLHYTASMFKKRSKTISLNLTEPAICFSCDDLKG